MGQPAYLVPIDQISECEVDDNEWEKNWGYFSIYNAKQEVKLYFGDGLVQANTSWVHGFISIFFSFHKEGIP